MFVEQKTSRLAAQKHGKLRELFYSSDSNLQEMLKEAGEEGESWVMRGEDRRQVT